MFVVPATQAHANANANTNSNGTAATTTLQQQQAQENKIAAPKEKAKATSPKPRDKSVLDAEVLDSPLAYFRNAFTSEEDETETNPGTGAVLITVKALIATLLSTVM